MQSSAYEPPSSQSDRVQLRLREMILRGQFRPGERLAELTLVPALQASRTPVRLALERLAHEGLLDPVATGGFTVREFTLADVFDAIELRGVLEGTAARLAAERLDQPAELDQMRHCCREAENLAHGNIDSFVDYLNWNEKFHRALWLLAKSPLLLRAIESANALPFASPGALVFADQEPQQARLNVAIALEQHRSLIDAIAARAGTRAEALAREHAHFARRAIEAAVANESLFRQVPGAPLIRVPATP